MGALDKYLAQIPDTFDVADLLDPDVEKIESTAYQAPLIFKYFSAERRHFFSKPQLRFSQREVLNDPLEMSVRWNQITTEGLRQHLRDRLEKIIPDLLSNTDLLTEMIREDLKAKGIPLTAEQTSKIALLLKSDKGQAFLKQQLPFSQILMSAAIDYAFNRIEAEFHNLIDRTISGFGVLSLTEDPLNEQMWAHYASQGLGFVIAFDAQHPFFLNKEAGKNLLRKIIYTDQKTENFWRNPYYLFLVKNTGWSYEREWRMFKQLSDCDDAITTHVPPIFLANLAREIIKAVYFGYGYAISDMQDDIAHLRSFGSSPDIFRIEVNRERGILEMARA